MVADSMSSYLLTYIRLTCAGSAANLLDRAKHWANGMVQNSIAPDAGVYNHIAQVCVQNKPRKQGTQGGRPAKAGPLPESYAFKIPMEQKTEYVGKKNKQTNGPLPPTLLPSPLPE